MCASFVKHALTCLTFKNGYFALVHLERFIFSKVTKKVTLQRKKVDDVLGGAEAWKNVDQTEGYILLLVANITTQNGKVYIVGTYFCKNVSAQTYFLT